MIRRTLLSFALAALACTLPALAQAQSTGRDVLRLISQKLDSVSTLEADFVQLNADGSRSNGTLSVHRPGRMRMTYTGDNAPLVIVGGQQISLFDSPRRQTPEVYPLRRTPLWMLLQPNPQLENGRGVERVWAEDNRYYITTYDPNTPEAGRITFQFAANPLALEGWVSRSQSGETVTVALTNLREGMKLSSFMFSSEHEVSRRGGDR